ncbi:hypothetical protein OJ612_02045 [Streptococcus anginosus]|uniref:hypothetical protein n=1 Tax=Streptococcus anginosus TaxID=1328 RepID=UPI000FEFEC47|nr:hypothetical protein [Streptococcus anginosus]MCW0934459.1 hypothetical protein [Streptococcus anginosus]MCW1021594.1 hypothetical protein [Streptococcus anginosus]MCW1025778.1 hypothetical protein [Streptococcus anginosus]RGY85876.1 hypothetical protein DXA16_08815 [Streptococcus anginosus]
MSLLDIAKSIKKEGFDPRKDSTNGPAPIPAGTYPVVLKKAIFNIAESSWESIQYQFEIRGGDYNGRTEFASFGTLDEWKGKSLKWATERTMKFFIKALVLAGDNMTGNEEDGKALEEALQRKAVGSYYNLVITENKGKDGRTFRSYDLEEEVTQPITEADIDDDDFPF